MGTNLHQTLKSLCFNTEWKYSVFWELRHRARMVLTWEDGYYEKHEQPSENNCLIQTPENLHDGHNAHDPLGLVVAKMSYYVHPLGEGMVGQVAVTGEYQWIFADKHGANSCSSFESCDGWQTQFSAGIRTIVVIAVVPRGVLQLGSLNTVIEDINLVSHIRNVFSGLQDSMAGHIPWSMRCSMKNSLHQAEIATGSFASEVFPDCVGNLDKAVNKEQTNVILSMLQSFGEHSDSSYVLILPQEKAFEVVNKHESLKYSTLEKNESSELLWPGSKIIKLEHMKDKILDSDHNVSPCSHYSTTDNDNLYNILLPVDMLGVDFSYFPSDLHSAVCDRVKLDGVDINQNRVLQIPEPSGIEFQKDLEKMFEFETKFSKMDTSNTSLKFPADLELHEALGADFLKKSIYFDWDAVKTEAETTLEMSEEMSRSQLTFDSGSEHLLDAVVAKVCHSCSDVKSEKSSCKSVKSLLTTEQMTEPSNHSKHTMNSSGCSINLSSLIEEDAQHCLNSSQVSGLMTSKGFSSTCPSTCSEHVERSSEPAKKGRKRAKPDENCRSRPRDRQLIQDRIKELRELVPNGSKCSIDSLLECTIQHMLFLQSITKQADKLNKSASSKLHHKETTLLDSYSYEQGSSWAVEVGSQMKICSIIVDNLNKKGQMLVEMVCQECGHFLEIAEAIRSLGLKILKGVTEAHGEKTWMCFVVEGPNSRCIHRMDILWTLVQILQQKTAV